MKAERKTSNALPTTGAGELGQAMAEYAIVIMFVVSFLIYFLPEFIDAINRYYQGFYVILNLPIP